MEPTETYDSYSGASVHVPHAAETQRSSRSRRGWRRYQGYLSTVLAAIVANSVSFKGTSKTLLACNCAVAKPRRHTAGGTPCAAPAPLSQRCVCNSTHSHLLLRRRIES